MMTYKILALCLVGGPALIAIAMLLYDVLGITAVRKAIRALPGLSLADQVAACACMWRALKTDWRTRVFDLSAPLVMAFVIPFVPRSANQLPHLFRAWDNNISLNGDSGAVLMPDGRFVGYHDVPDWEAVKGLPRVSYDDPSYTGPAYYLSWPNKLATQVEGKLPWLAKLLRKIARPRGWLARYCWVGLRNRATKLALDLGAEVDRPIETLSGSLDLGSGKEGHFLLRCGNTYHFKSSERIQFFGDRARIRSFGFKLEIALKSPDQAGRVAVVAIGWSAKPWKEA